MKVLIVFTHPNSNSFNHALLDNVRTGLTHSGHEVKVKDLYQEGFNPVLSFDDLSELHKGNIPPRIAKEHEDLLWAEGLVFIYPLWWLNPPAMLKGWFDVVLNQGVAFESSSKGTKGLLKHKKAHVFITAGASEDHFIESNSLDMSYKPFTEFTLGFCGIKKVSHKIHHNIFSKTDEERADFLREAEEIGLNF